MQSRYIHIRTDAYLLLVFMLFLIPMRWLLAMALAALVHEAGHWIAIRMVTGNSSVVTLGMDGARMELPQTTRMQELICAMAGPALGLCLVPLASWMPRVALCALVQSGYNLLPIWPLDGGRAAESVLYTIFNPICARRMVKCIRWTCTVVVCLLGLYGTVICKLGLLPVLLGARILFCRK